MTEFNEQQPIVNISEMSTKERAKYITDEMIYNEDELAFVRARKEANKSGVAEWNDFANRLDKSMEEAKNIGGKLKKSMEELKEFLARSDTCSKEVEK